MVVRRRRKLFPKGKWDAIPRKGWEGASWASPGDDLLQLCRDYVQVLKIQACTPSTSAQGVIPSVPNVGEEARGPG